MGRSSTTKPRIRCLTRAFAGLLTLLVAAPAVAVAEEASFTAQISADTINLDETLQLTISLARDSAQPYQGYIRPDLNKDFDILHQQQAESTQWTMTGGRQSVRVLEQHMYVLKPRHKGVCAVPPATVRLGGRELRTTALSVRVNPAPKKSAAAPTPPPMSFASPLDPRLPGPEPGSGEEDIFVEARADKSTVYLGEPVTVTWRIFTQSDILRYRTTAEPKHDDFWSEDLYVPPGTLTWDRVELKGKPYQMAVLLKKALFPLKSGKLNVSALGAEATTQQTLFYPRGSAVRGSRPIAVEVLPLPAAGRPDNFDSTNVGRFDVISSVDKSELKAGDAVSLKVTLRGEGNIRNVKLRKLERVDGFRVYEPSVVERVEKGVVVRGEKVYTYLLLPERGGDLVVPSVTLAYFDPMEKRYFNSRAAPIPVHVVGDPQKLGTVAADPKDNVLGPMLQPPRKGQHIGSRLGERILRGQLLAVALGAPPGLIFLVLVGDAVRVGLSRDTAGRRRRRARAAARGRLRAAENQIKAQRPSAFFGECARALYEHLEYRLGVKVESFTLAELGRLLVARGFDEDVAAALVTELESCDFARFAPSASGPGEMRAAIRRVRLLLAAVEKARVREAA